MLCVLYKWIRLGKWSQIIGPRLILIIKKYNQKLHLHLVVFLSKYNGASGYTFYHQVLLKNIDNRIKYISHFSKVALWLAIWKLNFLTYLKKDVSTVDGSLSIYFFSANGFRFANRDG